MSESGVFTNRNTDLDCDIRYIILNSRIPDIKPGFQFEVNPSH